MSPSCSRERQTRNAWVTPAISSVSRTGEGAERGRVEEGGLGEVHHDVPVAFLDQLYELGLELGSGVQVQFAADAQAVFGALDGADVWLETHGMSFFPL